MTQIKLTLDAERDLIDIYLYGFENFGHAQAERYAATLNEKMAVAADYPSFGADLQRDKQDENPASIVMRTRGWCVAGRA